ncbi:site-specific integrase [Hungatella sp.]|uniref:tyrosine-type recombinase/integrase n=1 Tax=Hungatella sp. TaxID=2613924 RepID=UPI002A7ED61E|nr:site-specific integrase [Hungatella sp.]
MTVKNAYEKFMELKESYCDKSTCEYYAQNLGFFFDYLELLIGIPFEKIEVDDMRPNEMQHYIKYLRNKPKYENHPFKIGNSKKGSLKNSTIRIYTRAVRVFLNFLNNDLDCEIEFKKPRLPSNDSRLQLPLYDHEVQLVDELFSNSTENGLRNLCMIHLMLDAGLRSEEVIALRVKNICFDKDYILIEDSKNHKSRIVPLAWNLRIYIRGYLEYRIYSPDDHLLLKCKENIPINYNVMKQLFSRLRTKTGIDRLHPHLLRHTFAVSYLIGGGNLEFLRDMLGHSDYTTTRDYVKMANQYRMMDADVYQLDDIFFRHVK